MEKPENTMATLVAHGETGKSDWSSGTWNAATEAMEMLATFNIFGHTHVNNDGSVCYLINFYMA
jgi:hypothetical protein